MNIVITETSRFRDVISKLSANVSRSEANRIQTCIKLTAQGSTLYATALDTTSHQMVLTVPATVQIAGSVLIDATHFAKTLKALDGAMMYMDTDEALLHFTSGDNKIDFPLFAIDADKFPEDPVRPPVVATLQGTQLKSFVDGVLGGVRDKDQDVLLIAKDTPIFRGYVIDRVRGMYTRTKLPLVTHQDDFVFRLAAHHLSRLPEWGDEVSVHCGDGILLFACGEESLLIRTSQVESPTSRYDALFDRQTHGYAIVTDSSVLIKKLGVLSVGKDDQIMRLKIERTNKRMHLIADSFSGGTAHLEMGLGDISGETPECLFDCLNVAKAVRSIGGNNLCVGYIQMPLPGGDSIWAIKCYDEIYQDARQALVMPIQKAR